MFTGLIEEIGMVSRVEELPNARRFWIEVANGDFLHKPQIGESICVSGTCLTATNFSDGLFAVTAVEETLRRTNLGDLTVNSHVNLERALRADARLGGHIVQGHVDGVADLVGLREEGESWWATFAPPTDLLKFIVEKGSICLDGISLTVANIAYNKFSVAVIPHTFGVTTAGRWHVGARVNVEVDVLAKYVERLTSWAREEKEAAAHA